MRVALGFRTHSGWAVVVAVGQSAKGLAVCDRRLIVLADSEINGSKQPFHTAEPMSIDKAKEFLTRCTASTNQLAVEAVRDCAAKLRSDGHELRAGGLMTASGRLPESVEAILASHAAIHAAEGEFYRSAVANACDVCGLPLTKLREKGAIESAAQAVRLSSAAIRNKIGNLGKEIGPPWSEDQKLATLAAWIALEATKRRKAAAV